MFIEVTRSMFHDEFRNAERLENFSYEGRDALFNYLVDLEKDTKCRIEFDVIALCCEYAEGNIEYVLKNYDLESLDQLKDETTVIWEDDERVLYVIY